MTTQPHAFAGHPRRHGLALPAARPLLMLLAMLLGLATTLLLAPAAHAQIGSDRYSSIVMDAATGRILWSASPDAPRHPASLTKMMTLYMAFEALRDRRISLNELVPVSAHAAAMEPTKLGLVPGMHITVEQAILGMVTRSANDAACALGEMLGGGDELRFARMMTLRAHALGMSHTIYHNASGLPDPDQWTTARDLAVLARHLIRDFPAQYHYFSTPEFRFHGQMIVGHDHMLQTYPGADGLKTGYTNASGFNLVTSAVRDHVRLIGVVLGAAHPGERDLHMASLLDQAFRQYDVGTPVREARGGGLIAAAHAAPAPLAPHAPLTADKWAVQVGAFASEAVAHRAAAAAHRLAGAGETRLSEVKIRHGAVWRAQVVALTQAQAAGTCAALARQHQRCTTLRPEPGQLTSR
ncbi:MAG: D-alanyl-D-alanine carboxypeptidase [Rhodospirillales bacterium]|nr:D-alanyl-D-alanine carboxypeptidase [Rhodospirillales bacterium]MDE2198985.1 D-alanyl-D-alanine carboxypeptidase [Rhodospirillales bacterium]